MIGPLRPTIRCWWKYLCQLCRGSSALALMALLAVLAFAQLATAEPVASSAGDPLEVRLRFLWGSGGGTAAPLSGSIEAVGGALSKLQPLGMQIDEAAAVRLSQGRILIRPLLSRRFDGCDVMATGDRNTKIIVKLAPHQTSTSASQKTQEFVTTLGEVAERSLRETIGNERGYLMIQRAPGDRVRVELERDSLVFSPGETWQIRILPEIPLEAAASPIEISASVRRIGETQTMWQQTLSWEVDQRTPLEVQVSSPNTQGAFELVLTAKEPVGFAKRFLPGTSHAPLLQRSIGFVVVDPEAHLPQLTGKGSVELTIDPTNDRWWQRLPQWAQIGNLPGVSAPRPLGNVKPQVRSQQYGRVVALPASPQEGEVYWQAYTLPVRQIGAPHAIEIELPQGRRQQLAVSIIEPDAAGRVEQFGRDTGFYDDETSQANGKVKLVRRRLVFWPRTKSPVLLLANRSFSDSAEYGAISLVRLDQQPAGKADQTSATESRTIAAYLATPELAEYLGAQQSFDPSTGLSTDTWQTHLQAAQRLTQQLRAGGYNTVIMTVAADGSSLTPLVELGASPRFESGRLTAGDPLPKDVLEVLLRVFDREGLKIVPAVQLTAPLPALEELLAEGSEQPSGVLLVGSDGRPWDKAFPNRAGRSPRYNLLNQEVQRQLQDSLLRLVDRYSAHPSFAGLAVQLSGTGYAMLPGLKWGLDDETYSQFASDVGVTPPSQGDSNGATRFAQRASELTTGQRAKWIAWRQARISDFYEQLATALRERRDDLQLTLCTEELVTGAELSAGVQRAAAGRTTLVDELAASGIDLQRLQQTAGVNLLRPRRFDPSHSGQQQALAKHLNTAADLDRIFARHAGGGAQATYVTDSLRLPSFDKQSPFNPATTYLSLASAAAPTGVKSRQLYVSALSKEDSTMLATDSRQAVLGDDPALRALLQTVAQLPPPVAEARTEHRQPLTMRVYREAEATSICLMNDSPWPIEVALPLTSAAAVEFHAIGKPTKDREGSASNPTSGTLEAGKQQWAIQLEPFDLQAWRFADKRVRIESPTVELSGSAIASLNSRIDDLEQRMRSLDIRRSYDGLKSPGFEEIGEAAFDSAWQLRLGQRGSVDFTGQPHTGVRALRLHSEDSLGVAAESNAFETPNTGRLAVRAWYRAIDAQPDARLHLSVEYEVPGGVRRLYKSLGEQAPLASEWTPCEFVVDEIAAAPGAKMRVQFHLTGRGQAALDDVELYDLQFDRTTRIELAKQVYSARMALEQRRVIDCLQLVDGYWPRYLMSNVPPPAEALAIEPTPQVDAGKSEETPRLTERIRQWTPHLWR